MHANDDPPSGRSQSRQDMASRRTTSQMGRLGNRWAMWRALRALPARGFVSQPEPRSIGLYARGRQMVAGNFLFSGQVIESRGGSIWDIDQPEPGQPDDLHGFAWLDDLAAVGDAAARAKALPWSPG